MLVVTALGAVVSANAALIAIGPFASPNLESFDALAPGAYGGFAGMAGFAGFSRVPVVNGLQVGGGAVLPPLSAPNAMFGRGTNVMIRLQADRRKFGGYFRVPNAGIAVTQARFIFRNAGGGIVGVAVAPVNAAAWQWRGWDSTIPFRSIEIQGNGVLAGYVGMDLVRVGL
jgi:hypothetical protein